MTENLNDEDVVQTEANILISHTVFTCGQFLESLRNPLSIYKSHFASYGWVGDGVPCKILRCKGNTEGWQSGRVRIVLEFIPDPVESESDSSITDNCSVSPLEEIRQMISTEE